MDRINLYEYVEAKQNVYDLLINHIISKIGKDENVVFKKCRTIKYVKKLYC